MNEPLQPKDLFVYWKKAEPMPDVLRLVCVYAVNDQVIALAANEYDNETDGRVIVREYFNTLKIERQPKR